MVNELTRTNSMNVATRFLDIMDELGNPKFNLLPFANRGVAYADQSFIPAIEFLGKKVGTDYSRHDVHFTKKVPYTGDIPRVIDSFENLYDPNATILVQYDDKKKTGETDVGFAIFCAEHEDFLDNIDHIIQISHREEAGYSTLFEEAAWNSKIGSKSFEQTILSNPRLKPYHKKIKDSGYFARLVPIDTDYNNKLLEKQRRLENGQHYESTGNTRIVLIGGKNVFVFYDQDDEEVSTTPHPEEIKELMNQHAVTHLNLLSSNEKEYKALERFFNQYQIPISESKLLKLNSGLYGKRKPRNAEA